MLTVEQVESMLRDRAEVYPGHPAVPFLRATAEAFVEYAGEQVIAEREGCAVLLEKIKMDEILLATGELNASERRLVLSLLPWLARQIRVHRA